ncbi:uncharacterized protein PODANS_4_9400, partial [Podospora anserina S mat+]
PSTPTFSCLDVTRRYAKAYNSKTRRWRIDGLVSSRNGLKGERWLRAALRRYQPPSVTDLLQIELNELKAAELKEPMPRNVMDFRDHPVYALERHLRRNEVLVPGAQVSGTVGSAGGRGGLERIYRRRDVKVARTREKWFRLGRVVKGGEVPVKVLPKMKRKKKGRLGDGDDDEEGEQGAGNPVFIESQTEVYVPPPVVGGRVPRNRFGNVDVYVPSMVPRGGVHLPHERARRAAFVLGIDAAPALTGFEFRGRQGTAVLRGVVVAVEYKGAMEAVIQGLEDMEVEEEQERKTGMLLAVWRRMLKGLRIRERIMDGVDEEAEAEAEARKQEDKGKAKEVDMPDFDDTATPFHDDEDEDSAGRGGFFPSTNLDSDDEGGGGGFMVEEEEEEEGGGFVIE